MKPAWYSGYTTNINVEMNYWLAEPTNLPECHQPFFDWLRNLATVRKKNAQPDIAAKSGWIAYSTNNPMGGNSTWGIHRPGSAWMTQHLWTHYEFGGDKEFLQDRAYPALKELVEYWEDFLVEGPDGKLITPAGWSPEHGPVKKGDKSCSRKATARRSPAPPTTSRSSGISSPTTSRRPRNSASTPTTGRKSPPCATNCSARRSANGDNSRNGWRTWTIRNASTAMFPTSSPCTPAARSIRSARPNRQRRDRLAQCPRRRRHRLEQGLENQFLGPPRRWRPRPQNPQGPARTRSARARRRSLCQPVRRPPAVPDRRQFRRHRRHDRDAAAVPCPQKTAST